MKFRKRILNFFKAFNTNKKFENEDAEKITSGNSHNPFMDEAEKQRLIWDAFGVNYKRELSQLAEAKRQFLTQLNSSIMTDELRDFIEETVRDEVRRLMHQRTRGGG